MSLLQKLKKFNQALINENQNLHTVFEQLGCEKQENDNLKQQSDIQNVEDVITAKNENESIANSPIAYSTSNDPFNENEVVDEKQSKKKQDDQTTDISNEQFFSMEELPSKFVQEDEGVELTEDLNEDNDMNQTCDASTYIKEQDDEQNVHINAFGQRELNPEEKLEKRIKAIAAFSALLGKREHLKIGKTYNKVSDGRSDPARIQWRKAVHLIEDHLNELSEMFFNDDENLAIDLIVPEDATVEQLKLKNYTQENWNEEQQRVDSSYRMSLNDTDYKKANIGDIIRLGATFYVCTETGFVKKEHDISKDPQPKDIINKIREMFAEEGYDLDGVTQLPKRSEFITDKDNCAEAGRSMIKQLQGIALDPKYGQVLLHDNSTRFVTTIMLDRIYNWIMNTQEWEKNNQFIDDTILNEPTTKRVAKAKKEKPARQIKSISQIAAELNDPDLLENNDTITSMFNEAINDSMLHEAIDKQIDDSDDAKEACTFFQENDNEVDEKEKLPAQDEKGLFNIPKKTDDKTATDQPKKTATDQPKQDGKKQTQDKDEQPKNQSQDNPKQNDKQMNEFDSTEEIDEIDVSELTNEDGRYDAPTDEQGQPIPENLDDVEVSLEESDDDSKKN